MEEEVLIKGLCLVNLRNFVISNFGEPALVDLQRQVNPEAAAIIQSPFGHEWYPLKHLVEMEVKLADARFQGDYRKLSEFGRYDALQVVGNVYRFLLQFLDPSWMIKRAGRIYSHTFSHGQVEAELTGSRTAVVKLSGFSPIHIVYCHDWRGSLIGILELCNCKFPKVTHDACRLDGSPACVYSLRW